MNRCVFKINFLKLIHLFKPFGTPTSLVRFVRNFSPNELAPPVACIVDEVTPGRFKLYAEFVSGEQVLVVDVKP